MDQPKKRSRGRPTKLDAAIQDRICNTIRLGNYMEAAAASAGVSKVTLYAWLKEGARQTRGRYRDFLNAVERAEADREIGANLVITKAANGTAAIPARDGHPGQPAIPGDWRAAAWRLERTMPERYGRRVVEVTGKDGGPVRTMDLTKLATDELEKLEQLAEKALADQADPALVE